MLGKEKISFSAFFEEKAIVQEHPSRRICEAAATGNIGTLTWLVLEHPDLINESSMFDGIYMKPIEHAVRFGQDETIRFFARYGIDVDARHFIHTLFHIAAERGHASTIETLFQLGSSVMDVRDVVGSTSMNIAARFNHVSVIEKLATLGSRSIDIPDNSGWTPLHNAVFNQNCGMVATLLRLGSDALDFPDKEGKTPIYVAASRGREYIATMLFAAGSQTIDVQNNQGCTPLFAAITHRHTSMVELLFQLGSQSLEVPTNSGITPMHQAVRSNQISCMKVLMALGASYQHLWDFAEEDSARLLLDTGIDESEIAEIRYRVYFERSLVGRLLLDLERQKNLQVRRTIKLNA